MKEEDIYEIGDLVIANISPIVAKILDIHIRSIGIVTGIVFGIPECMFGSETIPLLPKHIKHLETL